MKKSQAPIFDQKPEGCTVTRSLLVGDPVEPVFDKHTKTIHLYGMCWDVTFFQSMLLIELFMFRWFDHPTTARLRKKEHIRGSEKAAHFVRIVDLLWNRKDSPARFDWHDYALRMTEASCAHDYLAIAGAASTGKSDFAAIYAIVQALAEPSKTLVIVTSTSLKAAKGRVWASIKKYFHALPQGCAPFKLVDSDGVIRYTGEGSTGQMGLMLVAGEASKSTEASSKLIGLKNTRVFMVADELSDLAESVLRAALDNLSSNPYFQLIGLSNPRSRFDPMGIISEPKDGWDSINIETQEWVTKMGYAIRLDGKYSPNLLEGTTVYPYLLTQAKWDAALSRAGVSGERSSGFLRMIRGWFPDSVGDEAIFSQADFGYGKAFDRAIWGTEAPIKIAGCDPAFAGGDRTILVFGEYGKNTEGKMVIHLTAIIVITDDATNKEVPPNHQRAQKIVDECKKRGVHPKHFGIDTTGAGAVMAEVIVTLWSSEIHHCLFAGAPSDKPMSPVDPTPAKEAVANRVSELWCCASDYLRAGHIRGMDTALARELSSRFYDPRASGKKRKVESKVEMKERIGYSPDIADAWVIMIDLVRQRLRMTSASKPGNSGKPGSAWKNFVKRKDAALTVATLRSE